MTNARTTAWIFLAIYFWDKNPVTRLEIVHSADAIEFTVPEDDELECALQYLVELGLVDKVENSFALSDAGKEVAESADKGATRLYDTLQTIEIFFGSDGAA